MDGPTRTSHGDCLGVQAKRVLCVATARLHVYVFCCTHRGWYRVPDACFVLCCTLCAVVVAVHVRLQV